MIEKRPALVVEPDRSSARWSVSVLSVASALMTSLGGRAERLLRVKVADAPDWEDLPDISGDVEFQGGRVRFLPHLPFVPGVRYRAILDLGTLGRPDLTEVSTCDFSFPKEALPQGTEVSQVFPSGDLLPENLLRFYIRFSNPMQRGRAEENIELLCPDGSPAPDVLYRAPVELWDRSMTCLTILLDPGRLKRGVGPNRMLGPPLMTGHRYTLAIGPGMIDADGRALATGFRKSFVVSEAVRDPINILDWKVVSPAPDSHEPLELSFPTPLDWAELWQGIAVASAEGKLVNGPVAIDRNEMQWRFRPDAPWAAGSYSVRISAALEDICGNTPYGAFDGPFRMANHVALETATQSIPFEVKVV